MKKTESELKQLVRDKYAAIAQRPKHGGCCSGTSEDAIDYSFVGDDYTHKAGYVPEADLGLGCGLPTEYAKISTGDTVVDLGSGAGNDCFVARSQTGESGQVIGIDFTLEMVEKARANAKKMSFENVKFHLGEIDNNPLSDDTADVVVSNCVFNLVPNKAKAFEETYRILKPGGHFSVSDIVIVGSIPEALRHEAELYAGCVSGAENIEEYLNIIRHAGFKNVEIQKKKIINIPEEHLDTYLDDSKRALWNAAEVGIFSITVYAEKPKINGCC